MLSCRLVRDERSPLLIVTGVDQNSVATRLAFSGEVDLSTSEAFGGLIAKVLDARSCQLLEVDLGGVRFMDSSGVKALAHCHRRAAESGCRLTVANPQEIVRQVLEITGLLALLTVTIPEGPPDP